MALRIWALFDNIQDLLEELFCGSLERDIALANLRLMMSVVDCRRLQTLADIHR